MKPRRLVFAGQAIVDIVLRVPALPERGGDMIATSAEITTGGGFNVMAAAARQGLPVLYAGGHGTGPWGDLVRAALGAEGITILRPADPGRDTGFDVALVEPDGERTFATHPGAETLNGGWPGIPMARGTWSTCPATACRESLLFPPPPRCSWTPVRSPPRFQRTCSIRCSPAVTG